MPPPLQVQGQAVGNGKYKIANVKGGTVVDLDVNQSKVHAWQYHGNNNQHWEINYQGGNTYSIRNVQTGGYLAVERGTAGEGSNVVVWKDAFMWAIWRDEKDRTVWRIGAPRTPFHLDLSNHGNSSNGNPIKTYGAWDGRNQCWFIEQIENQ
ncbi:hypothetical protein CC1G_05297 [Coprinopsis cinerea okayama7|uniref:Ricin B lectin domain-containing protein n=1 Tax=Coprinopsis cinerea (strain Okayama-7 / 130 / ATCC MYA-4618 / FGSC 9003) TaxID=240176 RepID=A8PCJ0_COPC7|nr:hypothetical protein CC1G_05297 [Coprinopsis cinerea okayama7\|eukprot:XP_001840411.1 hypothetical protein CC1G_05297 [Coprinopsis cinerea okayama7\